MATLETVVGWLSIEETLTRWEDAPGEAETGYEPLPALLDSAHDALSMYAPKPVLDPPPERYKLAQVLLTQHLWARKQAGDGEGYGADGLMRSTYPLVMEARSLVRPKRSPFAGLR